jgi:proliferating cell nuclear antigen
MSEKAVEIVSTHTYPFRIWSGCAAEVLGDVNADIIAPDTDNESDSESDSESEIKHKKPKNKINSDDEKKSKKNINKNKKVSSDDSEEEQPKKNIKKNKKVSSDDSEEEQPKKSVKKNKKVSSSEEDVPKKNVKKNTSSETKKSKKSIKKNKKESSSEEEKKPKKSIKKNKKDSDSEEEKPKKSIKKNKKDSDSEEEKPKKSIKKNKKDSDSEEEKPKKSIKKNKKESSSEEEEKPKKSIKKSSDGKKKKLIAKGNSAGKTKNKNIVKVNDADIEVTPKKKKGRPKKSDRASKFKYEDNVEDTHTNETVSSGGIKIIAVNPAKTVLVYTHLPAKNFEKFKCKKKKITIGLNLPNFHKFIKTMAKESTLTLYMEEDDMNHLGIRMDNANKNRVSNFKLNLLDLEKVDLEFEKAEYESYIRMPAEDFKQTCKNMQNIADLVEIKNVDKQLSFMCEGEIGIHEEIYGQQNKDMKVDNETDIVEGVFEIKYLVQFSKCAPLCDNIELYMRNDYPLIIKFEIPTLGQVYFCQSPVLDNRKNDDDMLDNKEQELSDISDDE